MVGRLEAAGHLVSQKGRAFQPGFLGVARGDTVTDDSDLLHHAFIEADTFSFDSGDQEPSSRTPVTFTGKGTFRVICGIHPKMTLVVRVNWTGIAVARARACRKMFPRSRIPSSRIVLPFEKISAGPPASA